MRRLLLPLALLLALLPGCSNLPTDTGGVQEIKGLPRQLNSAEAALVEAGNGFAFDLFRAVHAEEEAERNLFLSPLSASMALGMALNGANGTTFDAMRSTLGFGTLELQQINRSYRTLIELMVGLDPAVGVEIANSIWHHQGVPLRDRFLTDVADAFASRIEALDFGDARSVKIINDWVDEATKGRIPTILDRIRAGEILYLINAIHFKAPWTERFEKKATRDSPFTLADGSRRPVPMMNQPEAKFRWLQADGVTIADIPYGGQAFSMTILLPERGRSIDDLITRLDADLWETWIRGLGEPRTALLSLPRFRIEYEAQLGNALDALGMGVAFSPAADFSRMLEGGGVSISRVVQKTFVEVDEKGTEAAAATLVGVDLVSLPSGVAVDRPFVFAIRERFSGTILFIGKVMDPLAG